MQKLLNGVTVTGDSAIQSVGRPYRGNYRVAKVDISGGTATVALWGRASPTDTTWVKITEFAASGAMGVLLLPQVKFTVSAISGATVDAYIDALQA